MKKLFGLFATSLLLSCTSLTNTFKSCPSKADLEKGILLTGTYFYNSEIGNKGQKFSREFAIKNGTLTAVYRGPTTGTLDSDESSFRTYENLNPFLLQSNKSQIALLTFEHSDVTQFDDFKKNTTVSINRISHYLIDIPDPTNPKKPISISDNAKLTFTKIGEGKVTLGGCDFKTISISRVERKVGNNRLDSETIIEYAPELGLQLNSRRHYGKSVTPKDAEFTQYYRIDSVSKL